MGNISTLLSPTRHRKTVNTSLVNLFVGKDNQSWVVRYKRNMSVKRWWFVIRVCVFIAVYSHSSSIFYWHRIHGDVFLYILFCVNFEIFGPPISATLYPL